MYELHKAVGDVLTSIDFPGMQVLLDAACGGVSRHIRLYGHDVASRKSSLAYVDAALVMNDEIKVVIEVEFSDIRPLYLCGKVFVAALCNYYSRGKLKIPLADQVLFLQVIQEPKSSSKIPQCQYLFENINTMLESLQSRVRPYEFHHGTSESFALGQPDAETLKGDIVEFLSAHRAISR